MENIILPEPTPPTHKKRGKIAKRAIWIAALLLAAYLLYLLLRIFLSPDRRIQQVYLIPRDAAIIIQADRPVENWKTFSQSEPWQMLKQAPVFAEIAANANYLDSMIHANKALLSLVGRREMMISLHKTQRDRWDFLIVLDLQKISKVDILKEQIEQLYKIGGFQSTQRTYKEIQIIEMRDPKTRDILYTAFVDNHFVASYTSKLVEAAIDEREHPQIGLDEAFILLDKKLAGKGLCRLYVHYAYLPAFMNIYLDKPNEYLDPFSRSMSFAKLYFDTDPRKMEVKGYTLMEEESDPYLSAILRSGGQKMRAHEVMSARTALYANFGFESPSTFVRELEQLLSEKDGVAYQAYKSGREQLEKYFNISLEKHFLDWMSGEFAFSQSEPGLLGREPELILAIRASSIRSAKENMEYLERQIKRRSPVSIKSVTYKEYEINYIELKGFFKLFFGSLFSRFETPFYTYVGDYVVFSNKSSSLLSFVEDYEQKNLLKNEEGFKRTLSSMSENSTIFTYIDMPKFYSQLQGMLNPGTWNDVEANREVLYSFPRWMFQVVGATQEASMHLVLEYEPFEEPVVFVDDAGVDDDPAMDEGAESERELMNELKRFYVENFEGNILREFYPDGALKSEAEIRNGQRHGRYREYYEDGALKLRGKYRNNRPQGMWKYYTEAGTFDRKERF